MKKYTYPAGIILISVYQNRFDSTSMSNDSIPQSTPSPTIQSNETELDAEFEEAKKEIIIEEEPQFSSFAKLRRISTSGDARFDRYDLEMKELVLEKNPYFAEDNLSWFFAMPEDVPDKPSYVITDKWVKFIKENKDSI